MKTELRCLYCGHVMADREHHEDSYRDAHRPVATGSRDVSIDASAAVDYRQGIRETRDQKRTDHGAREIAWRRGVRG